MKNFFRSELTCIVAIVGFVVACFLYAFARYECRGPRMLVSSFAPLVLSAGRVIPLPSGDTLAVDGDETISGLDNLNGQIQVGSTAPGSGQVEWFNGATSATTTQLYMQETDTDHVGTGGNNEAINIVADQRGTFDTTAGPATANGVTVLVTSTRAAGASQLSNYGIICGVSGGDVNECIHSGLGQGGIQMADLAQFGPVTATDVSSGTIEATTSITATGTGTLNGQGNETFGTNSSNTAAFNSTITTVLNMSAATNAAGAQIDIANTGAGGNKWDFVSANTADLIGAGWGVYDQTFGWESLHGSQATSARPGNFQIAGHEIVGTTFNGALLPTLSSSCNGSGTATIVGTDTAFKLTTGTASTACTVSFLNTWTSAPICDVFPEGGVALPTCTISPTAFTCTVNLAATYNVRCTGQPGGT